MAGVDALAHDLAIGLYIGGKLYHGFEHVFEGFVRGFEGELLREEVDLGVRDAVELLDGVFELAGAYGAVDFVELE